MRTGVDQERQERGAKPSAPVPTILLVEGRKPASKYLTSVLNGQGYIITSVRTRREALNKAKKTPPAVIVLDGPSLRFDIQRFCDALREMGVASPVLLLIAEGDRIDRKSGIRAYLRYPFSARKLANRIARLMPTPEDEVLRIGDVTLNLKRRCVTCGGRESQLTPRQARLLEVFMRHPGDLLTRAFLMKQIWDTDYVGDTRTLEVHVHWLRKAIEEDPADPVYLQTVRRVGYRFEAPRKGQAAE